MTTNTKPHPGHKLDRYRYLTQTICECGWESAPWIGKGSRANAVAEWHGHIDKCKRDAGKAVAA